MNHNHTTAERSTLTLLRGLVPNRDLSPREAYLIAELQANRLLRHFNIQTDAVPDETISELPRIRIEREHGLPVSGSAHWNGRYWIISLNADEHPLRQRFSLAHEFKHVIDHTVMDRLYHDRIGISAYEQSERIADYFAACLLMPKRTVKRLWFQGSQNVNHLADLLQVSPAALRYRLNQLGLTEQPRRCAPAPRRSSRPAMMGARR